MLRGMISPAGMPSTCRGSLHTSYIICMGSADALLISLIPGAQQMHINAQYMAYLRQVLNDLFDFADTPSYLDMLHSFVTHSPSHSGFPRQHPCLVQHCGLMWTGTKMIILHDACSQACTHAIAFLGQVWFDRIRPKMVILCTRMLFLYRTNHSVCIHRT